ncbi:hypothetical protein [Flavobacterium aestivum]|uniref:hypothetical protein n=1 Tax=Flavobacterium aestivum TaxID=3003257 RepID=UPI002482430F|nr:hypothetical protein [Flavobacterium aestivum]
MGRIFIGFVICLLFFNCKKKENEIVAKNEPYVISYENEKLQKYYDSLNKNTERKVLPPSTKGFFYGESQLIVDKRGFFYFYQREYIPIFCSYRREKDSLPFFQDLKPKDIVIIPQMDLYDFISENILKKEKGRQILIIASQSDTIKNELFLNFLKRTTIQSYYIRRTTQEEDTVLKYKKNCEYYDFKDIKWDKAKIKFPEYVKLTKKLITKNPD